MKSKDKSSEQTIRPCERHKKNLIPIHIWISFLSNSLYNMWNTYFKKN